MSVTFAVWSTVLFAIIQVLVLFAVGRNLWPVLRKRAPLLLANRGVPYFIGIVIVFLVLPAALYIGILSHYVDAATGWLLELRMLQYWLLGVGLGFALAASYYGPKDQRERRPRRGSPRQKDGA